MSLANKGRVFSLEHRQRIGEKHKGKFVSEETRKKLSDWQNNGKSPMKGVPKSDEAKQRMSAAWITRKELGWNSSKTEEFKKNLSIKNTGAGNPNFGKILSDDTRKKISEANKGKLKGKHWVLIDGKRKWILS